MGYAMLFFEKVHVFAVFAKRLFLITKASTVLELYPFPLVSFVAFTVWFFNSTDIFFEAAFAIQGQGQ
jgi:hypothetical protein